MTLPNYLKAYLPFWFFVLLFKFGAGLHYTILAPLGEKLFPVWVVGLLIGGASFLQLIFDVPAGFLLDRFGYIRLLKITTLIFLGAALMFFIGFNQILFIFTIYLGAVGWLFFGPGVDAYVLSCAKKETAGRFMSLRDVAGSIGIVLATGILAPVVNFEPPTIGLIIVGILTIAFATLWFAPSDYASVHDEKKIPSHHFFIRRNFIPRVLKALKRLNPASVMLLISNLSASIFYSVVWFVVPIMVAETAAGNIVKSIGLSIFDFSVVILGFLLGRLADTFNKKWLVFSGLLLFGITGTFIGFNFGFWFIVLGFLATAGDEMANISLWAWLHNVDEKHTEDALIAGVLTLFNDFGWTIGPAAAGFLYIFIGPSWTIVAGASLILLSWLIYSVFFMPRAAKIPLHYPHQQKPHRRRHKE